ncbi:MAG TPA: DNA-processing protein DprA [Methylomirabilota bacterium]|nr:DNA-processing protein DprA [Methylomirabilota bacterium]
MAEARERIGSETACAGAARRLTLRDAEYPALLRGIALAPESLWVRGALAPDDALAVAVVGSRHATPYGVEMAERLSADLARRGVTIVSGLARGIDTAAHRGALRAGGRTIAVLGSGVDVIYPPENRRLAAEIVERGAILSQFAPGTPPLGYHFPARNRVIAGLALGVLVVEAAERSGALITAGLAGELGREVMAVPGRVTSPGSRGAHRLIQDGAALVEGWEDVVAQLPAWWRACVRASDPQAEDAAPAGRGADSFTDSARNMNQAERRLLAQLGEEPLGIDELIDRSGLGSGRAAALLLELELRGLVRQIEGKRFVLAHGA